MKAAVKLINNQDPFLILVEREQGWEKMYQTLGSFRLLMNFERDTAAVFATMLHIKAHQYWLPLFTPLQRISFTIRLRMVVIKPTGIWAMTTCTSARCSCGISST